MYIYHFQHSNLVGGSFAVEVHTNVLVTLRRDFIETSRLHLSAYKYYFRVR